MSKETAQQLAIDRAIEKLTCVDMDERCGTHGFDVVESFVRMRVFGMDMVLNTHTFELLTAGKPAKPGDHVLVLHYLLCDVPITEMGEYVSFRELAGGQFYWGPFQSRTVKPLVGKIGNDLDTLRNTLSKFDWIEQPLGDFAAKVHALGNLYVTLVWHLGDDEFPATVDVVFDGCVKRVFEAEDAVVMASRICIGCLF